MMLKVFDVGHGQCILFITPNRHVVLIDCAHHPNGWHPADALLAMGIKHVHSLVISNFDEDHARGLAELLARGVTIGRVWPNWRVTPATIRRLKNDLGSGIEFLLWMLDRGWGSTCDAADAPMLGCDIFRTWALSPEDYWPSHVDTNRLSLITEIKTAGIGVMIGGDMPAMGWSILMQDPRFRAAVATTDILIASHHGREDGCCDDLFAYGWRPGVVIMSDERQGHGTQDTGQYYRQRSLGLTFGDGETRHVLSTDRHGTIGISFPTFGYYRVQLSRGFRPALPATPAYRLPQSAPLATGMDEAGGWNGGAQKAQLKPDAPVTMTSRFEPKDTAAAFSALERLAKMPDAKVLGGAVDLNGTRSENDFLTLRLGRDVPIPAAALDQKVKELLALLAADAPTVKLRLDGIAFPSGRDLMAFCDAAGEDFDRVAWKQDGAP